jgi:hypothetical protein
MKLILWPESLVQEIADRRCILFLGSGVSASAADENGGKPKTWNEFLTAAAELVKNQEHKLAIEKLIKKDQLLIALEAIESEADAGDYHKLLNSCFGSLKFKPGDLHKVIYNLDARLVITTNFDKIYEQYWTHFSQEGFKTISYDGESLGDEIRSDTRLIIKAHGSIDNLQKMIFTRAQYHAAKSKYPAFYEILRALFLTHTVMFIGCGMQDPDVLLTLEEVKISSSSNRPHYALIKEKSSSQYITQDLKKSYNVQVLEFGPTHNELTSSLNELFEQVDILRATGLDVVDEKDLGASAAKAALADLVQKS